MNRYTSGLCAHLPQQTFDLEYVKELRAEAAKYRTQRNAVNEKLTAFGDYDDLKAAADKWQAQEDKNKTELEKLQGQIATLESDRDQALQQVQSTLIESAFIAEASKAGYANPGDVYHLADTSKVTINDEGQVEGVEDAVKGIGDRLPKAKPTAPSVDGGAGGAAKGQKTLFTEAEIREQAAMMNVNPVHLGAQYGVKLEE